MLKHTDPIMRILTWINEQRKYKTETKVSFVCNLFCAILVRKFSRKIEVRKVQGYSECDDSREMG